MSNTIKTIIFDLGVVLLNLDFQEAIRSFKTLGCVNPEEIYTRAQQHPFFEQFETGSISEMDFRNNLRRFMAQDRSDQEIDEAWNSLLKDLPAKRIELLKELKSKYKLILLSNTNSIHIRHFQNQIAQQYNDLDFFKLFDEVYLSHEVKMRKPNIDIFQWVTQKGNINPSECLFIDDAKPNIESAKTAGIKTVWLEENMEVTEILPSVLA